MTRMKKKSLLCCLFLLGFSLQASAFEPSAMLQEQIEVTGEKLIDFVDTRL